MDRILIDIKKSAEGFETTMADGNFAPRIIAFGTRLKVEIVYYAAMLATYPRGLA